MAGNVLRVGRILLPHLHEALNTGSHMQLFILYTAKTFKFSNNWFEKSPKRFTKPRESGAFSFMSLRPSFLLQRTAVKMQDPAVNLQQAATILQ